MKVFRSSFSSSSSAKLRFSTKPNFPFFLLPSRSRSLAPSLSLLSLRTGLGRAHYFSLSHFRRRLSHTNFPPCFRRFPLWRSPSSSSRRTSLSSFRESHTHFWSVWFSGIDFPLKLFASSSSFVAWTATFFWLLENFYTHCEIFYFFCWYFLKH